MAFGDDQIELYLGALGGVPGLMDCLRSFRAETDPIVAVDGYPTLADLGPEALRRLDR